MTRKQRERQELRFRILEAARELFASGGEEAVTLRRVADRVEYSATTIYLHFADKNALLRELCAADFSAQARVFRQAERVTDPLERLRKVAAAYVDFGLQNPGLYRLMFSPLPLRPATEDGSAAAQRSTASVDAHSPQQTAPTLHDFLYPAVFRAVAAGCFLSDYRDVAQITQLLWGGLHGVLSLHLARARFPTVPWQSAQAASETMLDCLIDGLSGTRRQSLPPRPVDRVD